MKTSTLERNGVSTEMESEANRGLSDLVWAPHHFAKLASLWRRPNPSMSKSTSFTCGFVRSVR